jgi:hypothetical protein
MPIYSEFVLLKSFTKFIFNFKILFKILLKILFGPHGPHSPTGASPLMHSALLCTRPQPEPGLGRCPSRLSRCAGPLDRGHQSQSDGHAMFSVNKTDTHRPNPSSLTLSPSHSLCTATEQMERPARVQPDERRDRLGGW